MNPIFTFYSRSHYPTKRPLEPSTLAVSESKEVEVTQNLQKKRKFSFPLDVLPEDLIGIISSFLTIPDLQNAILITKDSKNRFMESTFVNFHRAQFDFAETCFHHVDKEHEFLKNEISKIQNSTKKIFDPKAINLSKIDSFVIPFFDDIMDVLSHFPKLQLESLEKSLDEKQWPGEFKYLRDFIKIEPTFSQISNVVNTRSSQISIRLNKLRKIGCFSRMRFELGLIEDKVYKDSLIHSIFFDLVEKKLYDEAVQTGLMMGSDSQRDLLFKELVFQLLSEKMFFEATKVALNIKNSKTKDMTLSYVVTQSSMLGKFEVSLEIEMLIEDPSSKDYALEGIVRGYCLKGDFVSAVEAAKRIQAIYVQDECMKCIIKGLGAKNKFGEALELIPHLSDELSKDLSLYELVNELSNICNFEIAEKICGSIQCKKIKNNALRKLDDSKLIYERKNETFPEQFYRYRMGSSRFLVPPSLNIFQDISSRESDRILIIPPQSDEKE